MNMVNQKETVKAFNVLVVDDESIIQNILALFFERYARENHFPVNIRCTSDPVKALFELSTHEEQFDVVTLDVRMPKLVGDVIFQSLMDVSPDLASRIVFVTGYSDDLSNQFPEMDLKILIKPFSYLAFKQIIDAVLDDHMAVPEKRHII